MFMSSEAPSTQPLSEALTRYEAQCALGLSHDDGSQIKLVPRFRSLLENGVPAFHRDFLPGHFTGSALVTDPDFTQVLLTHHSKLDLWLQLGGHADGNPHIAEVALRESQEESGIHQFEFFHGPETIFDLDIHWIPASKNTEGHFHYDVRFLLIADPTSPLTLTPESKALAWFPLDKAYDLTNEPSMHRQFQKIPKVPSCLYDASATLFR
jgi:8-oxo-dGTP pyrophosphatase MutT (NUDIX family)